MQYMWQWRLFGSPDRVLEDGRRVRILNPGLINHSSGPDFFNAMLEIDGMRWGGNVELHVRASDWHRHGHHLDKSYDSVILHVVGVSDTFVTRTDGSSIPQLQLPFSAETADRYRFLVQGAQPIRCHAWIRDVPALHKRNWLTRAGMERLEQKSDRILDYVRQTTGEWNQAVFIALARALGFGTNSEPFELLGRSLPLNIVAKHANSLFQLEALLIGQAGLLQETELDQYGRQLLDEYTFMAHKYSLRPLERHIWKFSGTRPANMPHRKLALLARLLQQHSAGLCSAVIDAQGDLERLLTLLSVKFDGYWARHFNFGPTADRDYSSALSPAMARVVVLNVAAPLYRAYGQYMCQPELEELAVDLWEKLPAERNSVVRLWEDAAGLKAANAFESQALLHIRRAYCDPHKCLQCRLGHRLLRQTTPAHRPTPSK